ncbi:MAG: beta-carotene 15,15'-monooxygenase [Prevotella sp.]
METKGINNRLAEMSHRILVVLVVISVVLFGAFFAVGYDMPYYDNPQFSAPLLTDIVLFFIYLLFFVLVLLTGISAAHEIIIRAKAKRIGNGIPTDRIGWGVMLLFLVTLAVTFACGSTTPIRVNGRIFTSAVWLRLTDMFIYTSVALIFIALLTVAIGATGINRKIKGRAGK